MATSALEYDAELGVWYNPKPPKPRAGRPPGSQPPRIDWKDPDQRRAYKAAAAREYQARRVGEALAAGQKPCRGPLCNGTIRPLSEFDLREDRAAISYYSQCRACKNELRRQRYYAQQQREQARSRKTQKFYREQAIAIYGGQCELCGDTHDLQFDHVNWDGGEHRKVEDSGAMVIRIAKAGARITDYELRLLCPTCHRNLRPNRKTVAIAIARSNDWPVAI